MLIQFYYKIGENQNIYLRPRQTRQHANVFFLFVWPTFLSVYSFVLFDHQKINIWNAKQTTYWHLCQHEVCWKMLAKMFGLGLLYKVCRVIWLFTSQRIDVKWVHTGFSIDTPTTHGFIANCLTSFHVIKVNVRITKVKNLLWCFYILLKKKFKNSNFILQKQQQTNRDFNLCKIKKKKKNLFSS